MSDKVKAIDSIIKCWGVSDSTKLEAIGLVCRGLDPTSIVKAVEHIRNGRRAIRAISDNVKIENEVRAEVGVSHTSEVNHTSQLAAVDDYKVVVHGVWHEQYWAGYGCAHTVFEDCATGIGNSTIEAFDDALELLAQSGWDTTIFDEERERISKENHLLPPSASCAEYHFYVSVLVRGKTGNPFWDTQK